MTSSSNRPPNSTDVARLAGVSRATISYVFNGRRDGATVPEATRNRILTIADEIGYRPNRTARALKTGKTNTIALWAASFATPYYATVLGYVQAMAEENGYEVIVASGNNGGVIDSAQLLADGLIVIDRTVLPDAPANRVQHATPVVSMGAYFDRSVDHVGVDLYAATLDAMAHLYAAGRKRIAYLTFGVDRPEQSIENSTDPRIRAYIAETNRRGASPIWIGSPSENIRSGYVAVQKFWQPDHKQQLPDAILCLNDSLAIGAMYRLREHGVTVPGEVAVIGCDGIEECEFYTPRLTTLVQPVAQASRLAGEYLLSRMREPDLPIQGAILPAELVVRESA